MTFQILALDADDFAPLFTLDDAALAGQNARRMTVDSEPGFPCRVSLEEGRVGETVLLLNHCSQDAESPYRASHAIFVREGAPTAKPNPGDVPDVLSRRLLSVRGFDKDAMIQIADVIEGSKLAETLDAFFKNPTVDEIHIHNAMRGCYAAKARRA